MCTFSQPKLQGKKSYRENIYFSFCIMYLYYKCGFLRASSYYRSSPRVHIPKNKIHVHLYA